nr:MAG TPA: hypothetical protein [Bacteriophage sp.]
MLSEISLIKDCQRKNAKDTKKIDAIRNFVLSRISLTKYK